MSVIDQVEDFYKDHKTAVNTGLCLLGVVAAGGLAAKALRASDELLVANAGTPEFSAMMRASETADNSAARALQWKLRIGDPEVIAAPSRSRGASSWFVTIPDQVDNETVEQGLRGPGTKVQTYRDITVRQTPNTFEVDKPGYGNLILNKNSSTGRFYGPDGRLAMRLDPSGTEVHYGSDGKPLAAVRNMSRTLDFMGIFST